MSPIFRLPELQGDLIAGFTVGLTVLPQSIAYAKIANVPPQVSEDNQKEFKRHNCYDQCIFIAVSNL